MAERHVSLPKPFSNGDVNEWFKRFDICCRANGWNAAAMALKLPTLLEGEALAVWLELSEEDQSSYSKAREKIKQKMLPMEFLALNNFHRRKLRPGEALSVFVHDMKSLLDQAMPQLDAPARDQLLLHQFLEGIPDNISRQLRATGETKALADTVERARLLLAIDTQDQAAAVTNKSDDFDLLREQIATLTEQVAALSTPPSSNEQRTLRSVRCFACNRMGHIQRDCPFRRRGRGAIEPRRCYNCNRIGHIARQCRQGNDQGASAQGSGRPSRQ